MVNVFHLGKVSMLLICLHTVRCLYELQGVTRFLTRGYYHISSLRANKNGLIFIFQAEKRQQLWQNGQRNGLHSFERLDKKEDNRITV